MNLHRTIQQAVLCLAALALILPVLGADIGPSPEVPGPQSTVHGPFSEVSSPLSVVSSPSPEVPGPRSTVHGPFSEVNGPSSVLPGLSSMESLDDKHKLAISDRLSFRIVEDAEDPEEPREPRILVVTDSGELELPYLGRFPAQGKTCKQLAREIKSALEQEYYYQATVILAVDLMARTRGKVYLFGAVRQTGLMEIPSDETLTLSKAVMRAGGFTDFADRKSVKITRKGAGPRPTTIVVDLAEILDKSKIERDVPLENDDLITVPERVFRF